MYCTIGWIVSTALCAVATSTPTATSSTSVAPAETAPPPAAPKAAPEPTPVTATTPKIPAFRLMMKNWTFRPLGQYWARAIHHTGFDFVDSPAAEVVGQRARVGADIYHESGAGVRVLLQDVRVWGEELNTLNDFTANGFDVQEAFVDLPLIDGVKLRAGRQEIVLENARLIGNVAWLLRARSFDGLRLDAQNENLRFMLAYAKIFEKSPLGDGNVPEGRSTDADLVIGHLTLKQGAPLTVAATYIFDANYGDDDIRHTVGLTANGKWSGLSYRAEGFYQAGTLGEETVSAFLMSARLGYTFDAFARPTLSAWVDVLSGDGTPEGTFDTLYATNHKFYGEMDFFLNIPAHTNRLGLVDTAAQLKVTPHNALTLMATGHHFRGFDTEGQDSSTFGNELDLKAVWRVMPFVQLRMLYGVFFVENLFNNRFQFIDEDRALPEHFAYMTLAFELK